MLKFFLSNKVLWFIVISIMTVLIVSIFLAWSLSPNREYEKTAKKYLIQMGYKIVSHENTSSYMLSKEVVASRHLSPHFQTMGLRYDYFYGKELTEVRYVIKNHPLDNYDARKMNGEIFLKSTGKTRVTIYIADDKVIGGISCPAYKEPLIGGCGFKLDGSNAPGLE